MDPQRRQLLSDIAKNLLVNSIRSTTAAGSGHPTSCASCAEIMSVLFFHTMKYKVQEPRGAANDRFIMSKGHAAPILYAAWAEAGLFPSEDLLNLRKVDSDLEGHPTPRLNFIDVGTGSLGQGLSMAVGMAYVGKYIDKADYRVFCLLGDGETAEGSVWEALAFGSHYNLSNIVAIFDVNRLGQSEATAYGHETDIYKKRLEAFGWNTYVVDGHDVEALAKTFHDATTVHSKPTAIVARTYKGRGIPGIEDELNWHGKPLGGKTADSIKAIQDNIVNSGKHVLSPSSPTKAVPEKPFGGVSLSKPPNYKMGQEVAIRAAYGTALAKLGENHSHVIGLDGDTKNSTYAIKLKEVRPEQYIECFIAEQNLVGVGIGAACRNRAIPFVSTFAAFLSRAYDQIRMGAVSQTNCNFVGSHCGVSIGEDGPSQMALEDLAMFRAVPGATVFYPSDPVSTERAVELAANTKGICFIRTSRPGLPTVYNNDENFQIGKAKVLRQSNSDQCLVIGMGVTFLEACRAADTLAQGGVNVRVMDLFTLKPLDTEALIHHALQCGGRIVTSEDHYPEGGIGEAVSSAVAHRRDIVVKRLAVSEVPRSGKPAELLNKYGIDAGHIVTAVKQVLSM